MTASTIPQAPRALPLLGHALPLLRDPLQFLKSLPGHGDVVEIRVGPARAVVVCDPGLTQQVLRNDHIFDKGGFFWDRIREITGNGLVTCPRDDHRRQRRLLQPAFLAARLPHYAQVATDNAQTLADSWSDGQVVDVFADVSATTARIITAALLPGLTPRQLDEVVEDADVLVTTAFHRMFLVPPLDRLPTRGNRRHRRALTRFRGAVSSAITGHHSADRDDLLSLLLTRDADGRVFSDSDITDQLITFVGAGFETAATAITWALHLVAQHPGVQEQLHAEVDAVLGGAPATHADLARLPLTTNVVNEAMRVMPPVWMFTRTTTEPAELGGHLIPAGMTIVCSPYLVHHRPDRDLDVETFDPDRWRRPDTAPGRDSYLPFGAGARKCIGSAFGLTEAVLVLATIAGRWRLEHVAGHPVDTVPRITLRPNELIMRAIDRKPQVRTTTPHQEQELSS